MIGASLDAKILYGNLVACETKYLQVVFWVSLCRLWLGTYQNSVSPVYSDPWYFGLGCQLLIVSYHRTRLQT
jgi:hypothetical protein